MTDAEQLLAEAREAVRALADLCAMEKEADAEDRWRRLLAKIDERLQEGGQ